MALISFFKFFLLIICAPFTTATNTQGFNFSTSGDFRHQPETGIGDPAVVAFGGRFLRNETAPSISEVPPENKYSELEYEVESSGAPHRATWVEQRSRSRRSLKQDGEFSDLASLSKNISAILQNLLMDYNNQVRPGFREGKTTTIRMNMLIRSMGPISEKDMKYSMDCYVRQEWHDDRLKFRGPLEKLTLDIKMLEAVWKPDTYFHNGHGSHVHTITRPNKLFRIDQDGNILYSMRLTVKAKCPMELKNFPMDKQSCPLLIGSFAYPVPDVVYEWDKKLVSFAPGMTLNQYDMLDTECRNYSARWKKGGVYSILRVNFNLQRHTGYFLIQVYVPCILIVVLSWVSFWINREATSDRVGLGITSVLTLSTIGLDTRTDLPKVHYATALDWFILMSFGYTIATVLQFAAVHYFTKRGSGENSMEEEEEEEEEEEWVDVGLEDVSLGRTQKVPAVINSSVHHHAIYPSTRVRRDTAAAGRAEDPRSKADIYVINIHTFQSQDEEEIGTKEESSSTPVGGEMALTAEEGGGHRSVQPSRLTVRTTETQTDRHDSFWSQFFHCVTGNDEYRRKRTRQAIGEGSVNSVSLIDTVSKVLFPTSYTLLNLWYWYSYYHTEIEFSWTEPGFDYFDHSFMY